MLVTTGDLTKIKNLDIQPLKGFHRNDESLIRTAVLIVGYPEEVLASQQFQDYLKLDRSISDCFFDPKKFDLGYFYTSSELPVSIEVYSSGLPGTTSDREMDALHHRLNEVSGGIDLIDIRLNDDILGGHFQASTSRSAITKGPWIREGGSISVELDFCMDNAHERLHLFSLRNRENDLAFFGDAYGLRSLRSSDKWLVCHGAHSEGFLEDPENPGFPIPTVSPIVHKAIKEVRPKFYDTHQSVEYSPGKKGRILTTNPSGSNIMLGRYGYSIQGQSLKRIKADYMSDFQRALLDNMAESYQANPQIPQERYLEDESSDAYHSDHDKSTDSDLPRYDYSDINLQPCPAA